MSLGRKKQPTQFSRFVMKLIISGGLLIALAINIAACARKDVGELVTRKPNFVLEETFHNKRHQEKLKYYFWFF